MFHCQSGSVWFSRKYMISFPEYLGRLEEDTLIPYLHNNNYSFESVHVWTSFKAVFATQDPSLVGECASVSVSSDADGGGAVGGCEQRPRRRQQQRSGVARLRQDTP